MVYIISIFTFIHVLINIPNQNKIQNTMQFTEKKCFIQKSCLREIW